jgi:hypothetical protein
MAQVAQVAQSPDPPGPSGPPVAGGPGIKTYFLAWVSRPRHVPSNPSVIRPDRRILP